MFKRATTEAVGAALPWDFISPDTLETQRALGETLARVRTWKLGVASPLERSAGRFGHERIAIGVLAKEEEEHAALLARLLERAGETRSLVKRGWRAFFPSGLSAVAAMEIVNATCCRLLRARTRDCLIETICDRIVRDEAEHLRFFASHCERLRPLSRLRSDALFRVTRFVAWSHHARCFTAIGSRREEFFRIARQEQRRFSTLAGIRDSA